MPGAITEMVFPIFDVVEGVAKKTPNRFVDVLSLTTDGRSAHKRNADSDTGGIIDRSHVGPEREELDKAPLQIDPALYLNGSRISRREATIEFDGTVSSKSIKYASNVGLGKIGFDRKHRIFPWCEPDASAGIAEPVSLHLIPVGR
jgi:hypothetical protein